MPPLVVGAIAAFAVGLVYAFRQELQPAKPVLGKFCFAAVAGVLPVVVYTALAPQDWDGLLWSSMALATALALAFLAAEGRPEPLAVSYGPRGLRLWVLILLASLAAYGWWWHYTSTNRYYWVAAVFGMVVGASEIVSRYRDEPMSAVLSLPGLFYLTINGAIAAAAYHLLDHYQSAIFPAFQKNRPGLTCIVAGFGAMAVMRSKLFHLKTPGGEEVAVGPDAVILVILRTVDNAIDRWRSVSRQSLVNRATQGVEYSARVAEFFKASLASYQNLSSQDKTELVKVIDDMTQKQDMDPQLKMMAIAFGFVNIGGENNFTQLMTDLNSFLKQPTAP
jgi:hypothetical protein